MASAIEAKSPQPHQVARIMPSTSPIAQPVRQCSVAETASWVSAPPPVTACACSCAWTWSWGSWDAIGILRDRSDDHSQLYPLRVYSDPGHEHERGPSAHAR